VDDKQKRAELMEMIFDTRSWTAVESMRSETLRSGLAALREKLEPQPVPTPEPMEDMPQ
jgi:hypothetical protein